jgi:C-terminal processing protease CtpA/Prc
METMTSGRLVAIVRQIANMLEERYLFEETGIALAKRLRENLVAGVYESLDQNLLAQTITSDLQTISSDLHLQLSYDPSKRAMQTNNEDLFDQMIKESASRNFGFRRVENLTDNVGYLLLSELPPVESAGDILQGAMAFLSHSDALILDLREATGGAPDMIQLIISYLVDETPKQLSGIQQRSVIKSSETLPIVPGKRLSKLPVYVLVSKITFSGAEALAYDLQALKRGVIVGERTRGGAHLSDFVPIEQDFILLLPFARALNPITNNNWEGGGVLPDLETLSADALAIAHSHAVKRLSEL